MAYFFELKGVCPSYIHREGSKLCQEIKYRTQTITIKEAILLCLFSNKHIIMNYETNNEINIPGVTIYGKMYVPFNTKPD